MRPRATIYKSGLPKQGELVLTLPRRIRLFYHAMRGAGLGLLTAAIAGIIFAYAPIAKEEVHYQLQTAGVVPEADYSGSIAQANQTSQVQEEAKMLGVDSYFSIVIPKIDAKSNIIANVDTANEREYSDALMKGVAHAQGTYFPGQGKPVFLFAHSTNSSFNIARYNAVFYLLSKLKPGDQIYVFFADKKYTYRVSSSQVTDPSDISFLRDTGNTEKLYLMTCTPPGTAWNRLFVIADPVKNQ